MGAATMFDERDDRETGGTLLETERPVSRVAEGARTLRPDRTRTDAALGLLAPSQRGERPGAEPQERPNAEPNERPAPEPEAPPSEGEAKPGEPSSTGGE